MPPNISLFKLIFSKFRLGSSIIAYKVSSDLKLKNNFYNQMNFFSASVRRKIRKAERNGIIVTLGGLNNLDLFYSLYRKRIHQLGSVGLPKKHFKNLLKDSSLVKLVFAVYQSECIGVAILNIQSLHAENLYFATSIKHNYLYPSYALHAKMIQLSIEAHSEYYSFGRSTINSSVHIYKQQWGAENRPLYYANSFENWSFRWIQKILRHIIPFMPLAFVRLFDHFVPKKRY